MTDLIWIAIFGAGIFQALFLGAAVAFRPHTNRLAGRLLSLLLALIGIGLFAELVQSELPPNLALLLAFLNINTELAVGPFYYLIVRSMVYPDRSFRTRDIAHFLPFAVGVTAWFVTWCFIEDPEVLYRHEFQARLPLFEYLLVKAGLMFTYLAVTLRMLTRASAETQSLTSGRHVISVSTLRRWSLGVGAIPLTIYLITIVEQVGILPGIESDQIAGIILAGAIFSLAWLVGSRPWLLSLKPKPTESARWSEQANLLHSYLQESRAWREIDLSRADLAQAVGWTERELSQVIRLGLNDSFYGLLNAYRLDEFERLAHDPARAGDDILTLAFEAGFSSKAVFYREFRARHQTTPSQYRFLELSAENASP